MDLSQFSVIIFPALVLAAILYSSVGHGGASGYIAVMVLFGLSPETMRPVALSMNLAVTAWVLWRHRASYADMLHFSPLILSAIPAAFVGGAWRIDSHSYQLLVGLLLLLSALRMCWSGTAQASQTIPKRRWLVVAGLSLGLLAGLTGVGGGVFLSPFLVIMAWSSVQKTIAPVAAFIFFNSLAGLSGFLFSGGGIPSATPLLVLLAFIGGLLGAELSLRKNNQQLLSYVLGAVLLIAGGKMFMLGLT